MILKSLKSCMRFSKLSCCLNCFQLFSNRLVNKKLQMGHLINPISTRLAFSSFWLSSWTDFLTRDFSYNLMLDKGLSFLLDWVFIHSWFAQTLTKNGIFLSHYRIIRRGEKFRVHCFLIYNSVTLLKSSFVELSSNLLGTESVEFLSKKELSKKSPYLVNSLIDKSLKSSPKKELLSSFETVISKSKGANFSLNKRLKKEPTSKGLIYVARLKKLYLTDLLSSLNLYFSTLLSSILNFFWSKIKDKNKQICVGIRFLDSFSLINPQFLARFIARRVTYGFQLQRVIKPLIKDLLYAVSKKKNKIVGFRIACSGRFDRKQIASYVWQKFGPVPLNRFSCNINYGFSTAFLKYGTCGIKVWVALEHKPIKTQISSRLTRSEFLKNIFLLFNKGFLDSRIKRSSNTINRLVTLFNSFSYFEKSDLNSLKLKVSKKSLISLNRESFLRFQLLALGWLRYENKFLKKF